MDLPGGTPALVKSAFNWKVILFILFVVVVITLILNKFMPTTITLTDTAGNVTGKGTVDKKLSYSITKS